MTGYYRTGCCDTGPQDAGAHVVCVQVTEAFLDYTRSIGTDLSTPLPAVGFPGLKVGDRWCICVGRWKQALEAGVAPPVLLRGTHQAALGSVSLSDLKKHAIDLS